MKSPHEISKISCFIKKLCLLPWYAALATRATNKTRFASLWWGIIFPMFFICYTCRIVLWWFATLKVFVSLVQNIFLPFNFMFLFSSGRYSIAILEILKLLVSNQLLFFGRLVYCDWIEVWLACRHQFLLDAYMVSVRFLLYAIIQLSWTEMKLMPYSGT